MSDRKAIKSPRRLIEVALPLDDINAASAYEKSVKVGKPTSVHHWFAPRTLTAARAILFAQLMSDPGGRRGWSKGKTKAQVSEEREKLFEMIRQLVRWENYNNLDLLKEASDLIRNDWVALCEQNGISEPMPSFLEPFCGRGTLPLEAQNLGLAVTASDLNPIPVLINKALLEYPKRFAGVQASPRKHDLFGSTTSTSLSGLINDIHFYGECVLASVKEEAGKFYPSVRHEGRDLPVIAWLWTRTVKSPNPAYSDCDVPLISSYDLSTKAKNKKWLSPVVVGKTWRFEVVDHAPQSKGTVNRRGATCLLSGVPISFDYIREEAKKGRLGSKLIAIVADSGRGRIYLPGIPEHEKIAKEVTFDEGEIGDVPIEHWSGCTNCVLYGYETFLSLFTMRQRFVLGTFVKHLRSIRSRIADDARTAGINDPDSYSGAIVTYLSLALSRVSDWNNSFSRWEAKAQVPQVLFGRHSISMCWNYSEANPLHDATGSFLASIKNITLALSKNNLSDHISAADVRMHDASAAFTFLGGKPVVVSTDPPYYDNIPYSNLADFFYVWLRSALGGIHPDLCATIATPKSTELVANSERHGGKREAQQFFITGMKKAIGNLLDVASPWFPITIYYAFKQKEENDGEESSTGWETFLQALTEAGAQISGTWPIRSESTSALKEKWNALASSIVLVCRKRPLNAKVISRRDFVRELNQVLPEALDEMTRGSGTHQSPVAPVDLSQAIIGPGMAVFSKYASVLEASGEPMSVRTALQLINRFLAEDDFDGDTQFCLRWFEQHGWEPGLFGEADVLARAKGTSVDGVKQAGVVTSSSGSVRMLKCNELNANWDPESDSRIPIWQVLHQLMLAYQLHGESGAARIYAALLNKTEASRQLAYRLYNICERKNWTEDARAYNDVVTGWSGIEGAAASELPAAERQGTLFVSEEIR